MSREYHTLWSKMQLQVSKYSPIFVQESYETPHLTVTPGFVHLEQSWECVHTQPPFHKQKCSCCILMATVGPTLLAILSTIQVGCRGFIDSKSLHHLFTLAPTSIKVQKSLTSQIIKTVIEESHAIWSLRNR